MIQNLKLFFSNFFTREYLLDPAPSYPFKYFLPLVAFFGLMFLLGIILPIWFNRRFKGLLPYQVLSSKIQIGLLSFFIIGFLLLFFRFEEIPWLSSRLLLYLLLLSFLIWLIFILKYFRKQFREDLQKYQEKIRQLKYLTLPKKEIKKWLH